jgi:hypothetical protein
MSRAGDGGAAAEQNGSELASSRSAQSLGAGLAATSTSAEDLVAGRVKRADADETGEESSQRRRAATAPDRVAEPAAAAAASETRHAALKPGSLFFFSAEWEDRFRYLLFQNTRRNLARFTAALAITFAIGVAVDLERLHDDRDALRRKAPYALACVAVLLLSWAYTCFNGARCPCGAKDKRGRDNTALFGLMFAACGLLWGAFTQVGTDRSDEWLSGSPVIVVLVIGNVLGRMLFPVLLTSSWLIVGGYIAGAVYWKPPAQPNSFLASELGYVVLSNLLLSFGSYSSEMYRRMSFLQQRDLQRETRQLREEAQGLKKEVMMYIGSLKPQAPLDLQSPVEKATAILRELSAEQTGLPYSVQSRLRQVIVYLNSNSGDMFKPQIEAQIQQRKVVLDDDTEVWLRMLLDAAKPFPRASSTSVLGQNDMSTPSRARTSAAVLQVHAVLSDDEQRKFMNVMSLLEAWNFDVFELEAVTNGHALLFAGMALFRRFDLLQSFNISEAKLKSFFSSVESGYRDNPYHNKVHAADVLQAVFYFLHHGGLTRNLSPVELLAALVAAAVHDYDHPGRTNQFFVATQAPLAVLYNDLSVLENHHSAQAFFLMRMGDNNIAENMAHADWLEFRKLVVDMVLATDLTKHFDIVSQFKSQLEAPGFDMSNPRDHLLPLKLAMKCGDVSHTARAHNVHLRWTTLITEEFYRQGDEERKLGLPVSPFMDRLHPHVPRAQVGFIDYLVRPMIESWVKFLDVGEARMPCHRLLIQNWEYWKAREEPPQPEEQKEQ